MPNIFDWLSYEIQKSFPNRTIVVDVWGAVLLAQTLVNVPVVTGDLLVIEKWLKAEPKVADDVEAGALAKGLKEAIEEFLCPVPNRRIAIKTLEWVKREERIEN